MGTESFRRQVERIVAPLCSNGDPYAAVEAIVVAAANTGVMERIAELEVYEKRFKWMEKRGFEVHGPAPAVHSWREPPTRNPFDGELRWTATRISSEFKTAGEACDAAIAAEGKL
jgi:hypothetical protein